MSLTEATTHAGSEAVVESNASLSTPFNPSPEYALKWSNRFNLSPGTLLLGKYSCVSLGKIPINGTMLVFDSAVSFFSKVFGKAREMWLLEAIERVVSKSKVHQLILTLKTGTELTFTAFSSKKREQAAALIKALLAKAKQGNSSDAGGNKSLQAPPTASAESSSVTEPSLEPGAPLPGDADDGNFIGPSMAESGMTGSGMTGSGMAGSGIGTTGTDSSVTADIGGDLNNTTPQSVISTEGLTGAGATVDPNGGDADADADADDDSGAEEDGGDEDMVWLQEGDAINVVNLPTYSARKEVARRTFDTSVRKIYGLIYYKIQDVFIDFHERMSDWDIQTEQWQRVDGHYVRSSSFKKKLGYTIGPKETRVKETAYLGLHTFGFMMEVEGHNVDVPMGDSFRVHSYFEFQALTDTQCEGVASIALHFYGRNMFRSKIEAGAMNDTPKAYAKLFEALADAVPGYLALIPARTPKRKMTRSKEAALPADDEEDKEVLPEVQPQEQLEWADADRDVFDSPQLPTFAMKQEVARDVMPCSAKVAYNALMLEDGSRELYRRYFEHGGEHESTLRAWEFPNDGARTRTLDYKKPLNLKMIKKTVHCYEKHFISFTKMGGFLYEVELSNPEVPSGNTFRVHSFWEYIPQSESATEVISSVCVHWLGKTMLKRAIESGTIADVTVSYAKLLAIAKQICTEFQEKKLQLAGRVGTSRPRAKAAPRPANVVQPDRLSRRKSVHEIVVQKVPQGATKEKDNLDQQVDDSSSLVMNLILMCSFFLTLWLLVEVIRLSSAVNNEIEFLMQRLRS